MNKEEKYSMLRIVIFGAQKQKDRKAVEIKDRREKTEDRKTGKSFEEVLEKRFFRATKNLCHLH